MRFHFIIYVGLFAIRTEKKVCRLIFLAGILNLLLPETRNQEMFETMAQSEDFIRKNPGPLWRVCNRKLRSSQNSE